MVPRLLGAALLALSGFGQGAGPIRAAVAAPETLAVYTCCGSLAGFDDTNPDDLTSMYHLYAARWSKLFPGLRWNETAFTDQQAMVTRLAAAVSAGKPPDMVFVQGGWMGEIVLSHLARSLDGFYTGAHVTAGSFLPGMARWAHFGGHWWAIPAVSGPLGGQEIYLPKYMTPLGYDNSTLRTFADYYAMSQQAVQFDANANLVRIGFWPGIDSWQSTGTLMCPPGHGLYDAASRPTATDPCNVAYLQYLKSLSTLYGGYKKLSRFLAADPDFLSGSPRSYLATGKAVIVPSGGAYWNLSPIDANTFGVKGGLTYQLTPLPPTPDGSETNVASYPSTMQEVVIPPGAAHAGLAFAVGKATFWDGGDVLGRSLSGSPVVRNQQQWLGQAIAGEAALRRAAGLPGNPAASLQGLRLQPELGLVSQAASPINPVDPYYQQQLLQETIRVLEGHETARAALSTVQSKVLAQERYIEQQYGTWNW